MIVLTAPEFGEDRDVDFTELAVRKGDDYCGRTISEVKLPEDKLAVMIKRDGRIVIPKGKTVIQKDDVLVLSGGTDGQPSP